MVNLFMCGNRGVMDGVILAALSLVKHSKRKIHLYLGTMDLTDVDPRYTPISEADAARVLEILREGNAESGVTVLDMADGYRRTLMGGKNDGSSYTPYAQIRLLADIYPLPESLIYIDCDVLFSGDVGELWDVELSGHHLAAVRDYYGRCFIYPNYVNSGVMLWDLGAMRRDGVLSRARQRVYAKKMLLPDQTALNMAAKKKYLPRRFNEQHKGRADTLIRHFSMAIGFFPPRLIKVKPWQPEKMHELLGAYEYDDIIERWQKIKSEAARGA